MCMSQKLFLKKYVEAYELPVTVEKEKAGFFAFCTLWKECYAEGESIEEVLSEIVLVAQSLIELYKEENIPLPLKRKAPPAAIRKAVKFSMPVYVTR